MCIRDRALTLEERYEVLGATLGNEIEIMQIGRDLQKKVKARIDKNQREYILREQLKLIREELGEDNTADDAEEFKKKLQELQAGDEVKEKISKEIERFKNTNTVSYTHLRAHETKANLVCRLLLEKKKKRKHTKRSNCNI